MAQIQPQRSPALHRPANSAPGYFEFNPALHSDTALIQSAMDSSHVHRLDAFHKRASDFSNLSSMPLDAHLYATRALPPVPAVALKSAASSKSLRSLAAADSRRRPSLGSQGRNVTTDCVQRQLPPLPLRVAANAHRRGLSIESVESSKPSEVEVQVRRPRAMRSISFRNFLKSNNLQPQPSPTESVRTASSMSHNSDSTRTSRDSRHDSIIIEDLEPAATKPHGRRPSTLSLNTLRTRKVSQENVPALPVRPQSARKNSSSTGSGRRWGLFGQSAEKVATEVVEVEDAENTPPVPITPPGSAELSCKRCYYYSMRNCNGWVMGGSHGDACENCTVSCPLRRP